MDIKKILDLKEASPMIKSYINTKLANSDAVLFYRLGDFYEFFFDDAVEMSKVLDLTLTGKDCGLQERAPMCGIPFHAAEGYINKLISLGYKVAICEQVSDVAQKKSYKELVSRDVVRIITPGTVVDESILNEKKNNYLASVYENKGCIGFSYIDISTGEFKTLELKGDNLQKDLNDILVRTMPSEILAKVDSIVEYNLPVRQLDLIPKFSYDRESYFQLDLANDCLSKQFGEDYKKNFGLQNMPNSIIASGALLSYVKETQKRELSHINNLEKVFNDKYMVIDINTRRNLEIMETLKDRRKKGSLIGVIDKTKSSMGARKLRSWIEQPLCDAKEINKRLDGVEELCGKIVLRDNLSKLLSKLQDIERISGRISYGNFNPRDCKSLIESLNLLPEIKNQLSTCSSAIITEIKDNISDFSYITSTLSNAIVDTPPTITTNGNFIKTGFNAQLDDYRNAKDNSTVLLSNYEAKEREETGIKNLKVGFNRVFGYYIEVSKQFSMNIPISYVRKQTVANSERYITEELKQLEEKILSAEENGIKLEQKLFNDIRNMLLTYVKQLQSTSNQIATLDCVLSLAELAIKNNYCKPKINSRTNEIVIVEGRHPVIEDLSKEQFIPNDTKLNTDDNRTMIITGPNMAGKSTYMRQVALITLMAHMGSFVPAKSAEIALTDRIFTRVGASDDLALGQSTFMVEMMEVANILQNATNKSLIILDEIGRGTSTFDGLSIAWAVIEYLSNNMNAKTLFSTHYHELTELENFLPGVKNYKISVKEFNGNIVFLRKIVRGGASRSFGIEVAALAGVPNEVIVRAKQISEMLEQNDTTKNLNIKTATDKTEAKQKDANYTEVIGILKDIDINSMTPLSAFETLCDLIERVKK